jgi:transketolase
MDNNIEQLAKLIRYYILTSTTAAGSGHPSSSLSATDLMAVLMFNGFFKADLNNHDNPNNDRLIFSKGHASPLFYALYAAAGQRKGDSFAAKESPLRRALNPDELVTLRKFTSKLEGHPTLDFPFTEVPTGSLGQGLSVGLGMALNARADKLSYKTFVLLGDSEMAEGSVWEAMASAAFYKLNNLVAILDVNRLGQRGETMYGHHTEVYEAKAKAFGWETVVVDGHNISEIEKAYQQIGKSASQPLMIIAKTLKGKGVSFMEDKDGWHGKAASREELEKALVELGPVDKSIVGEVLSPAKVESEKLKVESGDMKFTDYPKDKAVSTRKAYGNALANLVEANNQVVVLDAETSNSTFADSVKKNHPERFFEMYIAEQNMAGAALGFSRRGKVPFVSTFAAFFSRAFDQIRMSQYAKGNIKFVGSHAGVSIGEDGASQMGLEEIAMFRTLLDSVVLYPSDAVSTEKLVAEAAKHFGNLYIQTTRKDTAILYSPTDEFPIGGSKTLKSSADDKVTVVAAGVTLHEALAAYEELQKEGVNIRVIDLYSVKPIDVLTLEKAAKETKALITVEDHFAQGGIGEAVASALSSTGSKVHMLSVRKMPRSGKPEELLAYEEIDKNAIIKSVKQLIG